MPQAIKPDVLVSKARHLIRYIADVCKQENGLGTSTTAVYDTAWVAMVSKQESNGKAQWRFPESFQYLLETQSPEGGWNSDGTLFDGILHTMAALLALTKHAKAPCPPGALAEEDLASRITNAIAFLHVRLQKWDVYTTEYVGFEYLLPALLGLLELEGISFKFPSQQPLMAMNRQKLAKFEPRMLYGKTKTTFIHCLEAFIGKIDFDKVHHQMNFGSMLASPSSTSAYLMHCTEWDDGAEAYLRNCVAFGQGKGNGAVPDAFPMTIFELSWVVSTLLKCGFSVDSLDWGCLSKVADCLELYLQEQNGLVGFAPGLLPDADDTAKTILALSLLGRSVSPDQMIAEFETESHFHTYKTERNASFSANCNVLDSLLHVHEPARYLSQIQKTASFLCDSWWAGIFKDKWNVTPQYATMLLTQAMMKMLSLWDKGVLSTLSKRLVHDRVPVVLLEIITRTLEGQNSNGSWGSKSSCEVTAYAVITLASVSSFPVFSSLELQITSAIEAGRWFLSQSVERWGQPDYLWIGKVSYGSAVLSQTYCLAAMNTSTLPYLWGQNVSGLSTIPSKAVANFSQFFSRLPLFCDGPGWKLHASLMQGYMFLPLLERVRLDIFPRTEMAEDKYLEYIPLIWTASNIMGSYQMSANLLWDMMVISMLNYQADEYMEAVVGHHFKHDLEPVKQMIRSLCRDPNDDPHPSSHSVQSNLHHAPDSSAATVTTTNPLLATTPPDTDTDSEDPTLSEVRQVLGHFTSYFLDHAATRAAATYDQRRLRHELTTFLLAQLTHVEENTRFAHQSPSRNHTSVFHSPTSTYHDWVHTTSADDSSCSLVFAFYACLVTTDGKAGDPFKGVKAKYMANELCRHLVAMTRLYNDYCSIARDRAEVNLNSVNFPEFHDEGGDEGGGAGGGDDRGEGVEEKEEKIKKDLLFIAEYERARLKQALGKLEEMVGETTRRAWRLLVDCTDVYGQICMTRDIASRLK